MLFLSLYCIVLYRIYALLLNLFEIVWWVVLQYKIHIVGGVNFVHCAHCAVGGRVHCDIVHVVH